MKLKVRLFSQAHKHYRVLILQLTKESPRRIVLETRKRGTSQNSDVNVA